MSEHTTHPILWSAADDFRGGMSVMDSTTSARRDLPSVSSLLRSQMLVQGESLGVSWWMGESILVGWRLRRGITRFEQGNCIFDTRCKTVLQTDCLNFLLYPEGLFAQTPTQSVLFLPQGPSCQLIFVPLRTTWTVACQVPLSMGFLRQGYWSGLLFPSPGDLPDPGIELVSPVCQTDSLPLSHQKQCC